LSVLTRAFCRRRPSESGKFKSINILLLIKHGMKNYFYALGILIAFSLANCSKSKYDSEYILFTEPQPFGEKDLPAIPKKLQNMYFNNADSSLLTIDAKGLYLKERNFTILSRQHRDSSVNVVGDSLVIDKQGRRFPAKKLGDSLLVDISSVDTLFEIGEGRILRKSEDHYVFNKRSENGWIVFVIKRDKKNIRLCSTTESDLQIFENVGRSHSDTIPYLFELNKKQFSTFLKQNGFGKIDTLQVIKTF
jgi:hypothetical protein